MSDFDAELFMDSLDPEDKFNLRYQDDDLPFPEVSREYELDEYQHQFEEFFHDINCLYWDLTSGMSRLHQFGMDPQQEALVNITRYTLQLLRKAYRNHPLYDSCMEDE